jgi:DNA-binding GntR family transcriptional regulator
MLRNVDQSAILQLDRSLLREQVANVLRDLIVSGRIAPGTKITERDVADLLKISRMPARDALMDLEHEGLIVTRPGGRYVIQLSEKEVRDLYQVRIALEKLAIAEAVKANSPDIQAALQSKLDKMAAAIRENDQDAYTSSDIELHQEIWQMSNNHYLIDMLTSITGPIFMFIATQTQFDDDWNETLELHQRLVGAICAQNLELALDSISEHMQRSVNLALLAFQQRVPPQ